MPFSSTRRRPDARRGVTAVEYALVFPIILFTFFGLWEYARVEMIRQASATACYDAARRGTLPGASGTAMDAAAQSILDIYLIDGATVNSNVNLDTASCEVSVPLDQNTWIARYILVSSNVESECEFSRERFGLTNAP